MATVEGYLSKAPLFLVNMVEFKINESPKQNQIPELIIYTGTENKKISFNSLPLKGMVLK